MACLMNRAYVYPASIPLIRNQASLKRAARLRAPNATLNCQHLQTVDRQVSPGNVSSSRSSLRTRTPGRYQSVDGRPVPELAGKAFKDHQASL